MNGDISHKKIIKGMRQQNNETFSPPPLDGSLSPSEIIDWHIHHSPNWIYSKWQEKKTGVIRELKYIEFGKAVHQCARDVAKHLSIDIDSGELPELRSIGKSGARSRPVVALLNSGEPLRYFVMSYGIIRAGAVPFPISTNNSKEAVVHLLEQSGASFVVESPKGTTSEVDTTLASALQELEPRLKIGRILFPTLSHLFDLDSSFKLLPPAPKREWEEPCLLLHSSGSTSFPKVIPYSMFTYLSVFRSMLFGDESPVGLTILIGHLPPYHALGFQWGLAVTLGSGITNGLLDPDTDLFKPSAPPVILPFVQTLKCDVFVAVPSFYQVYAQDPASIAILKSVKSAVTSGGPIPVEVAKTLTAAGVRLQTCLGSTECVVISKYPTARPDALRFEVNPQVNLLLRKSSDSDTQFEMLIGEKDGHYSPNVFNDTFEGQRVYASGDLVTVTQEDDGRELIQIVGRIDDQIMHSTGEKTNPGPLQEIIELDPLVSAAIYFGRERAQVGVLIDPSPASAIDVKDEAAVAKLRNEIWPSIKKANAFAPTHSAVTKEMIIFSSPSKPFTYTAKGSIRRGAIIKEYEEEINQAYSAVNELAQTQVKLPPSWNEQSALSFVSGVVEETLERSHLDADADLFSLGLNSLSATRVRTILSRSVDKSVRLSPDIVYTHPTMSDLASAFLASIKGETSGNSSSESHVEAMKSMVLKSSFAWPSRGTRNVRRSDKEVVLLTGTTGGLGCHLLSQLIQNDSVSTIYALNRPSSSKSLKQRQSESFVDKGLDPTLLNSKKLQLLEARFSEEKLGLNDVDYSKLQDSTTLIIHNAWRLDFNLSLSSFEENVRGSRNLIDLALGSSLSPKFVFTSSIAAVGGYQVEGERVPEKDFFGELQVAVGGGYGESKAVVERILVNASRETGLPTCSVRIGQITSNAWSTTDWLPLIVRSAQDLKVLPDIPNAPITWIRSEDVSSAILDFGLSKSNNVNSSSTYHVVHPNPSTWSSVFSIFSQELKVPLVSYSTWLEKLEASDASLEALPTKKLLGFYQKASQSPALKDLKFDEATEAPGLKRLDTTEAEKASLSLRRAEPISEIEVKGWLKYWRNKGFITV